MKDKKRGEVPWWVISLLVSVSVLLCLLVGYALPHPYGAVLLVGAAIIFIAALWFNPRLRYMRLASAITASWLAIRATPDLVFGSLPEHWPLVLELSGDVPWAFDISVLGLVGVLLVLDFLSRSGVQLPNSMKLQPLFRIFSPSTQHATGAGANQVQIETAGNGNIYNINQNSAAQDQHAVSEKYARLLLAQKPDDPQARMALAASLAARGFNGFIGREEMTVAKSRELAEEAIKILDGIPSHKLYGDASRGIAKYYRALSRETQGEGDLAEADLRAAVDILPKNAELNYQLCLLLLRHDKYEDAIKHFENASCDTERFDAGVLLARLLLFRKTEEDQARSISLLQDILNSDRSEDARVLFETLQLLTRVFTEKGLTDDANALLIEHGEALDQSARLTIRAGMCLATRDLEQTRQFAVDALAATTDETPVVTTYFLAKILADAGDHEGAVRAIKHIGESANADTSGELVLTSAWAANDYGFLLTYCKKVRELGKATPLSRELEIATFETLNEFTEALGLIESYLSAPDDGEFTRYMYAKRSRIGKHLEREDLVTYDPANLPNLDDLKADTALSLEIFCATAQMLAEGPNPMDGYTMAYQLVRHRFDSPVAHQGLMGTCGPGTGAIFPSFDSVTRECAVAYWDERRKENRWVVIEDGDDVSSSRCEVSPSSKIAVELMGKRVGDSFTINRDDLQPRSGKISQIIHKIQFRVNDSLSEFEDRFPEQGFIRRFDFNKSDETFDLEAFVEVQERLNEPLEEAESLYRQKPLSVGVFATFVHRSVVESLVHLANEPEMPIRVAAGMPGERAAAELAMNDAENVVIDPVALATLYATAVDADLTLDPQRFFITYGALDAFFELRRNKGSRYCQLLEEHVKLKKASGEP